METNQENTNFLPIPEEEFYLILRFYGLNEEMQSGPTKCPTWSRSAPHETSGQTITK